MDERAKDGKRLGRFTVENWDRKFKSTHQATKQAKRIFNDEQYLVYRGVRPSCRITVPMLSVENVRQAAKIFGMLNKELWEIHQRSNLKNDERVMLAQQACVMASQSLKNTARRDYNIDPSGTFNDVR